MNYDDASCCQGYQVPATALTMHLSDEPVQRDAATTYRLCFEVLAVLFSTVLQGTLQLAIKTSMS
jgi:hypothetical protein